MSAPRGRDAAGRPVPAGSPDAVEPVPEEALPPGEALALARDLLTQGRPFFAHDVLEAAWKQAAAPERQLWQALAQVCVGLTHLQRGNAVGGARLLRRGADRLDEHRARPGHATHGVDLARVAEAARAKAQAVDAGLEGGPVTLWPVDAGPPAPDRGT